MLQSLKNIVLEGSEEKNFINNREKYNRIELAMEDGNFLQLF